MEAVPPLLTPRNESEALGLAIYEVSRGWRGKIDEQLRPLGLSSASYLVVWTLAVTERRLSQKELAELCFVESPSMVRLLDRLEARGLVRRQPAPGDRRKNEVLLTEAAVPLLETMTTLARSVCNELLQDIPEADIAATLRFLQRIRSRLEE